MMLENAVELLMDADSIIDDYLPKDESNIEAIQSDVSEQWVAYCEN